MSESNQLDLLMRTRPYVYLAMTLAASLMYFMLLPTMASSSLHIWFGMVLLIDAVRISIVFSNKIDKLKDAIDEDDALSLITMSTIISGCLWGSVGLVFFSEVGADEKILIFCIILAVATVSTVGINAMYKSSVAFVLMLLVPLIAGVYSSQVFSDSESLIIIGMIVIDLMYLLKNIHDAYITNIEVLTLRNVSRDYEQELLNQREIAVKENRAKSQFLANMSHDLRTPMHAILGFSELGNKSSASTSVDKLAEYFLSINKSGQRLLRLLDNILDMSKLEAGQMVLNLKQNDMQKVISKVVEELMPLFSQRSIEVKIDVKMSEGQAVFDEDRIMQVIQNLLSNAIKFTPDNSFINVKCRRTDIVRKINSSDSYKLPVPGICVSISDQGAGIPDDEFDEVFNKFVQTGKVELKNSGTGLGLSISKEIIDIHGGSIKAENSQDGGAVFTFIIPEQGPEEFQSALSIAA